MFFQYNQANMCHYSHIAMVQYRVLETLPGRASALRRIFSGNMHNGMLEAMEISRDELL
jgi:hypothetical protein